MLVHNSPGVLAGLRVLVVEDESAVALQVETLLADEGACVLGPLSDVSSAATCAVVADISAAVLDVHVGRDSIEPVARILAQRGPPQDEATPSRTAGIIPLGSRPH